MPCAVFFGTRRKQGENCDGEIQPNLLVTGAAGQLGRRVVELLLESKAGRVIATTRTPEKLAAARGARRRVRTADFNDPASLREAFAGADGMLLISTGDLFPLGRGSRNIARPSRPRSPRSHAHRLHVGPAPYPVAGGGLIDDHFWTEQALFSSPLEWTVLRHHSIPRR